MLEPLIIIAAAVFLLASTVAYACWSVVRVQLLREELLQQRAAMRQVFDKYKIENVGCVLRFEMQIDHLIRTIENESSFSLFAEEFIRRKFGSFFDMEFCDSDHLLARELLTPVLERIRMRVWTYCFAETLSGMVVGLVCVGALGWKAFRRQVLSPESSVDRRSDRRHRALTHPQ